MPANVPYVVHLDRRYELLGVYDSGTNITTWTLPAVDETVDTIVLGADFSMGAGYWTPPTDVTGATVTKLGKYDYGPCILGHAFDMSVLLTRPFARDQNGNADVKSWLQIRRLVMTHHRSGYYQVRSRMTGRTDRTRDFIATTMSGQTFGCLAFNCNGRADDSRIYLGNDSPRPMTISALQYECDYVPFR